ncbi:MAG: hypothetical protein ACTS42_02065 [Candidatus Hodgkinia cicadicola]
MRHTITLDNECMDMEFALALALLCASGRVYNIIDDDYSFVNYTPSTAGRETKQHDRRLLFTPLAIRT